MKPKTRAKTRANAFSAAGALGAGLLLSGSVQSAQYGVLAEMRPTGTLQSADARMTVRGNFAAKSHAPSGAGITMKSRIDIPFGCASDTIFENGFDP
jgi:hypothetical protein